MLQLESELSFYHYAQKLDLEFMSPTASTIVGCKRMQKFGHFEVVGLFKEPKLDLSRFKNSHDNGMPCQVPK
jgi:hypothetical protein